MFASKSIGEHLLRGSLGLSAFAAAVALAPAHPLLALGFVPIAFVALRGCPMCWTVGLAQTVMANLRGAYAGDACHDGTCALDRRTRSGPA